MNTPRNTQTRANSFNSPERQMLLFPFLDEKTEVQRSSITAQGHAAIKCKVMIQIQVSVIPNSCFLLYHVASLKKKKKVNQSDEPSPLLYSYKYFVIIFC